MSFSGSPGRNSLRRGSPVTLRSAPVAARSSACGSPRLRRHREAGDQCATGRRTSSQAFGQPRRRLQGQVGGDVLADEQRGCRRIVPCGVERGAEVIVQEVETHVGHRDRLNAKRTQPPALVLLHGREVDLEPADGAAAEAQGPAVVARTEEDDLGDPVAERTRRARRRSPSCAHGGRPAGRPGRRRSRSRSGRGGARLPGRRRVSRDACGPGGRGRPPASAPRGRGFPRASAQPGQGVIALAPAVAPGRPRRSER